MASKNTFPGFKFPWFNVKNIPTVVAVMISPSVIESSLSFFQIKTLHLCLSFFHDNVVEVYTM